ncbi:MAG: hypothetical protein N2314_07130 [Brevinematales bacterium]|nr:hypothetical protein [Brevinematales bacterium]
MKTKIYVFGIVGLMILFTGCSLLFGPLSRLSLETLANGEWRWTWVGSWSGYSIDFTFPRSLKTYVLSAQEKPGFGVYYKYFMGRGWYLHITPNGTLEEMMSYDPHFSLPNPLHVYVDPEQKSVIFCGANITNDSTSLNGGVFSYDPVKGKRQGTVFVNSYVTHAIPLGKTLIFQTNIYSVAQWNIIEGTGRLFHGWGSTPKHIFPLPAEKEENSLVLIVTNDTWGTNYWSFYNQEGSEKDSMRTTTTGQIGSNWVGAVGQKGTYLLMNSASSLYHLYTFHNGSWISFESKQVVNAAFNNVMGVDIVASGGVITIVWLIEPTTLLLSTYEETNEGLKKISERRLSTPVDKGSIEGVDLFYDKAGKRLFLGILHAVPPTNEVGVSYFWLRWF